MLPQNVVHACFAGEVARQLFHDEFRRNPAFRGNDPCAPDGRLEPPFKSCTSTPFADSGTDQRRAMNTVNADLPMRSYRHHRERPAGKSRAAAGQ